MSQSLNGYPWRVQTGNVPFFTFPSTPPSFLPANHYPYTFAPAPPFSINQIAQVPTTAVPVPSYAGIAVPQATGVDSIVAGPNGATFPVAAIPSLADVSNEHLHSVPPGAVAVTIANANPVPGQPAAATVVIQQPVLQDSNVVQSQDMAVIHAIGPPPPGHYHQTPPIQAHIAPAIITADGAHGATAGVIRNPNPPVGGEGMVGRYHGPLVATLPPQLVSVGAPQHNVVGVSLDYSVNSAEGHSDHHGRTRPRARAVPRDYQNAVQSDAAGGGGSSVNHFPDPDSIPSSSRNRALNEARRLALYDDRAGPSRILESDPTGDNDSLDSDSPSRNLASMIYGTRSFPQFDNDSDDSSENTIELTSNDSLLFRQRRHIGDLSAESQMSSDGDESSIPSESESNSPTNPSTLRLINSNAAGIVVSPSTSDILSSPATNASSAETLNSSSSESDEMGGSDTTPGTPETDGATSPEESNPLTLPVLINISDSDSLNSHIDTPASLITLTSSSSSSLTNSPSVSESNASETAGPPPPPPESPSVHLPNQNHQIINNSYGDVSSNVPIFVPVINQRNVDGDMEQMMSHRETAVQYSGPASSSSRRIAESSLNASQDPQEIHLVNPSAMTAPHSHATPHGHAPPLMYTTQGQLATGHHTQILQQHQLQPAHTYFHHSQSHDPTPQPVFPSYPSYLPQGPGAPMEMQHVAALPPTAAQATVVPLESNTAAAAAAAAAIGHSNVHVLSWQQALSQQPQPQHQGQFSYSVSMKTD